MNNFVRYFSKEEVREIFLDMWKRNIKSLHFQLNKEIEAIFYQNGKIDLIENNKTIEVVEPFFKNNEDLTVLDNKIDKLIDLIQDKFKMTNFQKDKNKISFDIKIKKKKLNYNK